MPKPSDAELLYQLERGGNTGWVTFKLSAPSQLNVQSQGSNNLIFTQALCDGYVLDFLIDSGASHSYIPSSIVQACGFSVVDCKSSDVKLPNGQVM